MLSLLVVYWGLFEKIRIAVIPLTRETTRGRKTMMQTSRKHFFGIVLGVLATILVANALYHKFGLELISVLAGLLVGLEVGFWTGATAITAEAHRKAFYFMPRLLRGLAKVAMVVVPVAIHYILWYSLWPYLRTYYIGIVNSEDPFTAIMTWAIGSIALFLGLATFWWCEGSEWSVKKVGLSLLGGILCLPATCLAMIAVAFCTVLICFGIVFLVTYTVLKLAGRYETMAITIGVVFGGLSGLAYGWTYLEAWPTMMASAYGVVIGLFTSWAAARVGNSRVMKSIKSL